MNTMFKALALSCVSALSVDVRATTIEVDSTLGAFDQTSCTIANAFNAAASLSAVGTCPAGEGNDVILLPQNTTIDLIDSGNSYGDALLATVNSQVLVVGNGSTIQPQDQTCSGTKRIMAVGLSGSLYINDLTIQGGCDVSHSEISGGGAIHVSGGEINLANTSFLHNSARGGPGGAIYADSSAQIEINDSNFVGNTSEFDGGAVYSGTSSLIVRRSYFSNNVGDNGGAIAAAANFDIENTTFNRNQASYGGAIEAGIGSISFSTFAANSASVGSVLWLYYGGDLTLAGDIFAHAVGGNGVLNCENDAHNTTLNFLNTNISDDPSCGNSVVVPSQSALKFGNIGTYGGSALAIPLGAASAAIGVSNCLNAAGIPEITDERGVQRPIYQGVCDVGAFEHDGQTYPIAAPPSPLGAGNFLISNGSYVSEYTRAGAHVRDFWPSLQTADFNSVSAVDADGLNHFGTFVGNTDVSFGYYSVTDDLWATVTSSDWNNYYGSAVNKIAHVGNRRFLTGIVQNVEHGIIVFESGSKVGWIYADAQINDLKAGMDGLLYVLAGTSVKSFDPVSLQPIATLDLTPQIGGAGFVTFAVGSLGELYLYRWDGKIIKVDSQGNLLKSTDCVVAGNTYPCTNIREMALSQDHMLFLADEAGFYPSSETITLVDDEFTFGTNFSVPTYPNNGQFVISPLPPDDIFQSRFE